MVKEERGLSEIMFIIFFTFLHYIHGTFIVDDTGNDSNLMLIMYYRLKPIDNTRRSYKYTEVDKF